jgi:hypothetical protein
MPKGVIPLFFFTASAFSGAVGFFAYHLYTTRKKISETPFPWGDHEDSSTDG